MIDYAIVIPARYASERLPGKTLQEIGGKPMVQHTWERARASSARQVVIATDHERIVAVVEGFGGQAVMTAREHTSGSDRIAECARLLDWPQSQLVVNLQADEPEMPAACLNQVATLLTEDEAAAAATLCWPIEEPDLVDDPNVVKAVFNASGEALWFSRSRLPWARHWPDAGAAMEAGVRWYRHLGLYAYRNQALQDYARMVPTPLERLERLEQLRFLETGRRMRIATAVEPIPPGVDTPDDLERVRRSLASE